ncbi:MAG: YdeI/OmpD-associated family protein [Acidobacteriales bacterium]|nr:YdeI/OmpD-associated family protein [Terriglobales bacterium]
MGTRDKRIDAYIAKSAPFAQPILTRLRDIVHQGCPEVEETIKWGHCSFQYKGILCQMAAFRQHCAFMFWKGGSIVDGPEQSGDAMGQFGRLTSLNDLPPKATLLRYLKLAMDRNEQGPTPPARPRPRRSPEEVEVPEFLASAIRTNQKASTTFAAFPYSKRKEYVEWLSEAKTDATRERRLKTAVEWLAEGKSRNWKYETGSMRNVDLGSHKGRAADTSLVPTRKH